MAQRKIDIVRIRKSLLPESMLKAPDKGKSNTQVFIDKLKESKKGLEIEDKNDLIIIWETITEK